MKRKTETEGSDAAALRGPKRSCIEDPKLPFDSAASSLCDLPDDIYCKDDETSESGSQYTATQTSTRAADTPLTPLSPARKFPSEFKTIKCTYPGCDKAYNRPARLAAHLRSHANDRPFRCTYPDCDKSYIEEKHLKQHVKGSHTNERSHICAEPGCGKSFLTATRLRRHQAVHEGQERFRCRDFPPCNQSFRKHQTLQRHIRSDHLKVSPFPCNYKDEETGSPCRAGFENSGALRRHQEREHGELRFWCDECSKNTDESGQPVRSGFSSLVLLQTHVKHAHVACMFCGDMCSGRESLEEHIEARHSASGQKGLGGPKRVCCSWPGCRKTFAKQANLNVHVRSVHQGQRFVCGQVDLAGTEDIAMWPLSDGCGESFTTKANLENHVRFVHLKFQRPERSNNSNTNNNNNDSSSNDISSSSSTYPANPGALNLLDALSGAGSSFRYTISCSVAGCTFKFATAGELDEHLQTQHFYTENFSGVDNTSGDILDDIPFQTEEYSQNNNNNNNDNLNDADAAAGTNLINWAGGGHGDDEEDNNDNKFEIDDTFWFGGDISDPDFAPPAYEDEWMRDEAEMRRLIGSAGNGNNDEDHNDGSGLCTLVDPALGPL